jgi:hypothetical protein
MSYIVQCGFGDDGPVIDFSAVIHDPDSSSILIPRSECRLFAGRTAGYLKYSMKTRACPVAVLSIKDAY